PIFCAPARSSRLCRSFLSYSLCAPSFCVFFFNAPATTEIYTLSLHDALPSPRIRPVIRQGTVRAYDPDFRRGSGAVATNRRSRGDRKSTRLNSSHVKISYAVFCLKKKKTQNSRPVLGDAARSRCLQYMPTVD